MKTFENLKIKNLELKNRIVMPPMCMDATDKTGKVQDFHFVHYVDRAIGGVGLIILEATAVASNGRITPYDLGIWSDEHVEGLSKIVSGCKKYGSAMAIQLAHAGRKCELMDEPIVAPSPIEFNEEYQKPNELTKDGIREVIEQFKAGAARADSAGFDAIEIHGAHGYLIHEFLSPLTNKRTDEYGGTLENRVRFLKEVLEGVKSVWPKDKAVLLRVSATDYKDGGMTLEDMVKIVSMIKQYIDIIHVSSGGLELASIKTYPGYQVKLAEKIKEECRIPTIAVGLISNVEHVEDILNNERADLVALGRELLRNPYWVLNTARDLGIELEWPTPYVRGFRIRKSGF